MEKTKTEGILRKRIDDIEEYQKQLDKLREIEKVVLKSELKDISTIYTIYDWTFELCKNRDDINTLQYNEKHYFLIVAALLYSPRIFAGQFLERGKRDSIAEVLQISPSHVSNSLRSVCSWYRFYRDFQVSLDYLYSEILFRIELNGLR
ncbi:hypothetical protein [Dysgonomonas macrotermitis]|uniref:Uncharacterized protein n=1 Tax=Dysgonomonas macrotermitis TaxID=1346286 RepID=A0A1M5IWZ1_9BACT|nr:hypothetical protein [Dysgonomonas macrotermitis]SHG32878.1 hypothetical protein SAMN05444362_12146 [Dysgonomonas macrotermitis]